MKYEIIIYIILGYGFMRLAESAYIRENNEGYSIFPMVFLITFWPIVAVYVLVRGFYYATRKNS